MTLPTYWCWALPLGDAATDARYIPMVPDSSARIVTIGETGADLATATTDDIVGWGLGEGEVGITFNGWGYAGRDPELYRHPSDALTNGDATQSPFFANGIADSRAWIRDYIQQYVANQAANPSIPDPTAFWMDYEEAFFVAAQFVTNWSFIKADPRWATEVCFFGKRTWADVDTEYTLGDPPDPGGNGGGVNTAWNNLITPLLKEASAFALSRGCFELVTAQWQRVKTANWKTTHLGLETNNVSFEYAADVQYHGTHQGVVLYASSFASLQGQWDSEMGSVSLPKPYSPWIQFIGEGGVTALTVDDYLSLNVTRSMLYGIEDILLWGDPVGDSAVEANWNVWVAAARTAEVVGTAQLRAIEEADEMSNKAAQTYIKHPSEVRVATVSFKHKLSSGDGITGTPTVVAAPSGPTISSIQINTVAVNGEYINAAVGEAVQFTVSGGTDGTAYRLTVVATTTGGETLVGLTDITVEDEA